MRKRGEEVHRHCEELRKIPCFIGSNADYLEQTNYMSDAAVVEALRRQAAGLQELAERFKSETNRCGEPTKGEKALLRKLREFGYC